MNGNTSSEQHPPPPASADEHAEQVKEKAKRGYRAW